MSAPIVDHLTLKIKPLYERIHDLNHEIVFSLKHPELEDHQDKLKGVTKKIIGKDKLINVLVK